MQKGEKYDILKKTPRRAARKEKRMRFERVVVELAGDYAVLQSEGGARTEVALALLPEGIREGTVLIFEDFEYRVKTF